MGETEIAYLKAKCNMLIDKAEQLNSKKQNLDQEIDALLKRKDEIELKLKEQETVGKPEPSIPGEGIERKDELMVIPVPDVNRFDPDPEDAGVESAPAGENELAISYNQVFDMIRALSAQMAEAPREEIVIRQLSTGGKLLELLADGIGKIFRFIGLGILMILVSLAVTVLLNEQMRSTLIEFIRSCVG